MNGKIYKLQCEDGHYYIGSTISELRFRLANHKGKAKAKPDRRVYKHIHSIGWDKVRIILIEEFECKTRQELYQKEDEHIRNALQDDLCLNHYKVTRSHEEELETRRLQYKNKPNQTEEQKQKTKERQAQWYANLTEEQKQRRREYGNRHYANLTEEQHEHRRKLERERYHRQQKKQD